MLCHGVQSFPVNHGGDAHGLCGFVPCQHQIGDLVLRNRGGPRRRCDGRGGTWAVLPAQPTCPEDSVVSASRSSGNAAYAPPARDSARHTGASSPAAEASGFRAFYAFAASLNHDRPVVCRMLTALKPRTSRTAHSPIAAFEMRDGHIHTGRLQRRRLTLIDPLPSLATQPCPSRANSTYQPVAGSKI